MKRRIFLAAPIATLGLPALTRAQSRQLLKFAPGSDVAILDPVWTTGYGTRNHAYMVFDTLYGQSGLKAGFRPRRRSRIPVIAIGWFSRW